MRLRKQYATLKKLKLYERVVKFMIHPPVCPHRIYPSLRQFVLTADLIHLCYDRLAEGYQVLRHSSGDDLAVANDRRVFPEAPGILHVVSNPNETGALHARQNLG